eukprot:6198564-Pleurochrysis_carterae.AAC.2
MITLSDPTSLVKLHQWPEQRAENHHQLLVPLSKLHDAVSCFQYANGFVLGAEDGRGQDRWRVQICREIVASIIGGRLDQCGLASLQD